MKAMLRTEVKALVASVVAFTTLGVSIPTSAAGPESGADWSQFMGPYRFGRSDETGLADSWPEGGPPLAWEAQCFPGWSFPVVAGGRVFILGRKNWPVKPQSWAGGEGSDTLFCLDREDGRILWKYELAFDPKKNRHTDAGGPFSTPAVDNDRIYVRCVAESTLHCVNVQDGSLLWKTQVRVPPAYHTGNPLTYGKMVIYGWQALDRETGEKLWDLRDTFQERRAVDPSIPRLGKKSFSATPIVFRIEGEDQVLFKDPAWSSSTTFFGVVPETGKLLWYLTRKFITHEYYMAVKDNRFYTTSSGDWQDDPKKEGSNKASYVRAFEVIGEEKDGKKNYTCRQIWKTDISSLINKEKYHWKGLGFSSDWKYLYRLGGGGLLCLDVSDGKVMWCQKANLGYTRSTECGGMVAADGKLIFAIHDKVNKFLVMCKDTPESYQELGRFMAGPMLARYTGKVPALSNGHLFVRVGKGLVKCYDIREGE